jgi:hypothetical protein
MIDDKEAIEASVRKILRVMAYFQGPEHAHWASTLAELLRAASMDATMSPNVDHVRHGMNRLPDREPAV